MKRTTLALASVLAMAAVMSPDPLRFLGKAPEIEPQSPTRRAEKLAAAQAKRDRKNARRKQRLQSANDNERQGGEG